MTSSVPALEQGIPIGRYLLHRQIARGGMATIHIARLMGDEGFSRIVAAKRLLPEFAEDSEFVTMFLDEARVASKVHHRNVVPVLDVVVAGTEVILVQEYVHGAPLHKLLSIAQKSKAYIPANIAVSIACQVLAGLQAAHETADEIGMPLNIVHRDVSPQNIMVAVDGTARLLDFGVAKATMAAHITRENAFKGKLAYSAPEQLQGAATAQSDVYSLAVVLWELVVGHRMHDKAQAELEIVGKIVSGSMPTITEAMAEQKEFLSAERWKELELLNDIVKKGLAVAVHERWANAAAMERALTTAITPAPVPEVAAWLKTLGKELLEKSDKMLAVEEASWRRSAAPGRLTPLPTEPRTTSRNSVPKMAAIIEADEPVQRPILKEKRPIVLLVLLGAAGVACLAIIIGLIIRKPPEDITAPVAPKQIEPAPVEHPATGGSIASPVAAPATAPAATAPGGAAIAPTPAPTPVETPAPPPTPAPPQVTAPTRPTGRYVPRQPPPRPAIKKADPTPAAVPAVATPTPPAPPPCSPPYYFDGTKKVFKPECL